MFKDFMLIEFPIGFSDNCEVRFFDNFIEADKYMRNSNSYMELYYRDYKPLKGFCYKLSEKREHGKQIYLEERRIENE